MSARVAALAIAGVIAVLREPSSAAAQPPAHPIDDLEVARVAGGKQRLLAPGQPTALVFVRPGQASSRAGLQALSPVVQALGGKVRWLVVVSDSTTPEGQREIAALAGATPVVLDPGDRLYATLNIALHPTVVLVDPKRRALFLHPFSKLEFGPFAEAKIRHALGELDDAGLRRALEPEGTSTGGGDAAAARRLVQLGERLLAGNGAKKALELARRASTLDPRLATARALEGRALLELGEKAAAARAFALALALDPKDAAALDGKRRAGL